MIRTYPVIAAAWRSRNFSQPSSRFLGLRRRYASGQTKNNDLPSYIKYGVIFPMAGITMGTVYAYYSCLDYVPYTNRKRLICTSTQWEEEMGHKQYKELLQHFKGDVLPPDHRASVTVKRVGSRIAAAAKSFSMQYGQAKDINATTSPYTYTVVRSKDANAFVIPGNHVFVLTGIFRYAHNEDDLASVLGHEMAHNLARHAGERVSESILITILSRLVLILDPTGILFTLLVPAQQLLVALPHSREHEIEADKIGIVLASEACYDPRSAKVVFSRMKDGNKNSVPPEFISTHPGYDTRLSYFDKWMPDALERYNRDGGNKCRMIREEMVRARKVAASMHHLAERGSR